jgi:acylphosphatase
MLVARRFLVSGRVQGVGFRYFVQEAALLEGISGWVRNLPDGAVEVVAEGDAEAVERFSHKIGRGPSMARVENVDVTDETPSGRAGGFTVKP